MAKHNEEEKEKKALIILPIFIGGAAAAWFFLRRKVVAHPDKAILFGRVTDAETGGGINGINVNCNGYMANTDATGHYEIINIEPGTYGVMFSDPLGRYEPKAV